MLVKILEYIIGGSTYILFIKRVDGVRNIPDKGPYIIASNHTSYMDIWAITIVLYFKKNRYIRFLAKKELLQDWYVTFLQKLFYKPENKPIYFDINNPTKDLIKESIRALKKNQIIGIFPESKRSLDGKIQKGKTGMVRIALRGKVPIIPIGITGAFEIMPTGKNIPKPKKKITLNIGKPIYLDKYYKRKITKKLLRNITDKVMKEIAKLSGQRYNSRQEYKL